LISKGVSRPFTKGSRVMPYIPLQAGEDLNLLDHLREVPLTKAVIGGAVGSRFIYAVVRSQRQGRTIVNQRLVTNPVLYQLGVGGNWLIVQFD